ncbi:MAG: AlpA family phage regulatory protein [Methylococcales bacterium]|nr:AlpA family phage regulatory protein [Methylococcales bacterium]
MATNVLPKINQLLRLPVVKQVTGYSGTTIYRNIQKGLFVRAVKIGGDRSAWPENEIDALNRARIAGKSDNEIRELVVALEAARQNDQVTEGNKIKGAK